MKYTIHERQICGCIDEVFYYFSLYHCRNGMTWTTSPASWNCFYANYQRVLLPQVITNLDVSFCQALNSSRYGLALEWNVEECWGMWRRGGLVIGALNFDLKVDGSRLVSTLVLFPWGGVTLGNIASCNTAILSVSTQVEVCWKRAY